ncbi:hypothetical protein BLS_001728 [Venturia inaequalis]|uniref:NADP-dependent oxidoreductase domain-containing protein n=1 Tax=Venturia inaequalis TaxID=5025 RepID=A0A8H3U1K7_VENIN|nr:hypothetical protein BLS_001728 [Venturia inaequalis]
MSFGSPEWQPWVLPEDLALPLLKHAYDRGINTWDTADVYSNGLSEILIARAIQKYRLPRASLVLMTKCYFGMAAWEFQALQNIAEKHNWHKFISMQNYYNLLYREEEREMIPYCKDTGVGIIPWSPLARGKHTPLPSPTTL